MPDPFALLAVLRLKTKARQNTDGNAIINLAQHVALMLLLGHGGRFEAPSKGSDRSFVSQSDWMTVGVWVSFPSMDAVDWHP